MFCYKERGGTYIGENQAPKRDPKRNGRLTKCSVDGEQGVKDPHSCEGPQNKCQACANHVYHNTGGDSVSRKVGSG